MGSKFDVNAARKHFPTVISQNQIYFDNAGGSQTIGAVADSIKDYLYTNNVQLGATYKVGEQSTNAYNKGMEAAAKYINAAVDEIAIGPSSTQLFRNLSIALMPYLRAHPSPEIVVSTLDHEANIASWVALPKLIPNVKIVHWTPRTPSAQNPHLTADSLRPLLNKNTVLVTCTHTSNILGTITDIASIAATVHEVPGAMLCVDGVAYAPHRPVDMKALGVDFYCFSWYKVFGPHIAQLFARREAQDRALDSLGHFFKEGWTLEEKVGLAGASYELLQALPVCVAYLKEQGWSGMIDQEVVIAEALLSYLRSKPDKYKILGEEVADKGKRVPVISFDVLGRSSKEVVEHVEKKTPFGFRWGHFYSKRLVDDVLGLDENGVVRVSMLHYNTVEEVNGFIEALDSEVCGGT